MNVTLAMNSAAVSRLVSAIPERTVRCLSGTAFSLDGARACSDPARLVSIVRLLQWLSPLNRLSDEEQRALGLQAAGARTGHLPEDGLTEADDEIGDDSSLAQRLPL